MTRPPPLLAAACRTPEARELFDNGATKTKQAKAVCNQCFERPECLAWALEHEPGGIWGGHGPIELAAIRKQFGITLEEI